MPFGLLGWFMFWSYMSAIVLSVYWQGGMSEAVIATVIVVGVFMWFRKKGFFKK